MDTPKHVFQLDGVNAAEAPVLRKKLRRKEMVAFFEKLSPTVIAIEACGASHQIGTVAAVVWAYGEVDCTATGQTIRQARQERGSGRRSAVRGDEPADDALCAGEDGGAAGRPDAGRCTARTTPILLGLFSLITRLIS
jgi:hypothetical protein